MNFELKHMRNTCIEEVSIWQSAASAERALSLDRRYPILTVKQTEHGSPIFVR